MSYAPVAGAAERAARWAAIALGCSIPVSVALDNALLALIALLWVASGNFREKGAGILHNPIAVAACLMMACLALGLAYGARAPGDGTRYLAKYSDLVFVPILATLFRDEAARRHALLAFAISIALTLVASYLMMTGTIPENQLLRGSPLNPIVLKASNTHNILMAFGAFLFAALARASARRDVRIGCVSLAGLALFNVVFVVQGRTGYLLAAVLLIYFMWSLWGWAKGVAAAAVLGATLFGLAYHISPTFQARVDAVGQELAEWRPGEASGTSVGLRLEFYRNTIQIVRENPLFGVGTGGFPKAYAEKVTGTGMVAADNPHNEYLLLAAQLGVMGLAFLFYLFYAQWKHAPRLASRLECDLARGIVITVIFGSLFNSMLLDHTEGLLYAWMTGLLFGGLQSRDMGMANRKW